VAKREERRFGFKLDFDRLEEVCVLAYETLMKRDGIFSRGVKRFLPQFNLPLDLDNASVKKRILASDFPWEVEVSDPSATTKYLWTCVFFERMNQSDLITRNAHAVWGDPRKNWMFQPERVADANYSDIEDILMRDFQFNLQSENEDSPATRFRNNADLLIRKYGGDPREIVDGSKVGQARRNLMEFQGIGTGIANLFIIYLMDRKLACPSDPENALLKVDVHKGRIPVNCGAVTPTNGEIYRDERYADDLEKAYHSICKKHGFDARRLDAALWAVGSKGCARQDYTHCRMVCPLFDLCEGFTPEDKKTGRFLVYDENGKRIDTRRYKNQELLFE